MLIIPKPERVLEIPKPERALEGPVCSKSTMVEPRPQPHFRQRPGATLSRFLVYVASLRRNVSGVRQFEGTLTRITVQ
jgi:hypothetical protein